MPPGGGNSGGNVPHISLEGINMAIFVQVQDLSGRLVWVNPRRSTTCMSSAKRLSSISIRSDQLN